MIRAGAGIACGPTARAAAEAAAAQALETAGRADAAFLFASLAEAEGADALLDAATACLGTEVVVGASAHGVLGCGLEVEQGAAVSILALSGLETHPFLLSDLRGSEAEVGNELLAHLGGQPREEDLVVLLPDPRAFHPERLLGGIRRALGPARTVGAGAADPIADHPLQWCGRDVESGALAGAILRCERPARIGVTQACRPVTELLTVTRAQGHWILELDGRPALDVYREVARGPLAADLRRAAAFLLVALPRGEPGSALRPGNYVVRNVAGFATERDAIALPEPVKSGQSVALALREPEAAREDLKDMLGSLSGGAPAAGLYFDCCARAAGFFGVPGLEAAYLENAFGGLPLVGMFGSSEIGPVAGDPELLTYTGVLALLDA